MIHTRLNLSGIRKRDPELYERIGKAIEDHIWSDCKMPQSTIAKRYGIAPSTLSNALTLYFGFKEEPVTMSFDCSTTLTVEWAKTFNDRNFNPKSLFV